MYAIVDFKGEQFRVEEDKVLKIAYLSDYEVGSDIEIPNVLMLRTDEETIVGRPTIENSKVTAEVLAHKKDKKVIVFKKKRRKGYEKKQGHRQKYTEIKIKEIIR